MYTYVLPGFDCKKAVFKASANCLISAIAILRVKAIENGAPGGTKVLVFVTTVNCAPFDIVLADSKLANKTRSTGVEITLLDMLDMVK